jgi:hypothetical protein
VDRASAFKISDSGIKKPRLRLGLFIVILRAFFEGVLGKRLVLSWFFVVSCGGFMVELWCSDGCF